MGRLCLACGTVGPPEDAFCTTCGRALPPVVAGPRSTALGRALGMGGYGEEPLWRRLPMWAYGIAIGAVALVLLAAIVLTRPSGSAPARAPGIPFEGVGYGLSLPSAYSWVYSQGPDGDEWHFQPVGGVSRAIRAMVVTDLQPAEQTLEGALGRMESGVPAVRRPFVGSPESLALQAGPAYRVTDSAGLDTYVFFKGGRALFVEFRNVPRADEDGLATSVTLK